MNGKTLLAAERLRTSQRIAELTVALDGIVEASQSVALDDEHDPDGSTVAFERAQVAALLDAAQVQLIELDAADERLRLGNFGRCEKCATDIAAERLEAMPLATKCVACA